MTCTHMLGGPCSQCAAAPMRTVTLAAGTTLVDGQPAPLPKRRDYHRRGGKATGMRTAVRRPR